MSHASHLGKAAGLVTLLALPTVVLAAGGVSARPRSRRRTGPRSPCLRRSSSFTLFITKWAASKTKSAADFYTAGGGITGFQNGLAIAGDYMSAASFLGISAAVMVSGYDGLIYSIGFLVGWPILTFLMAEKLPGTACRAAKATNLSRWVTNNVSAATTSPRICCFATVSKAALISESERALKI